jgi:Domain of unknown function (DUF6946)
MAPAARLFGLDRVEITDLDSWFRHAPPEEGEAQWKDGYSAKEQAKAWLRSGAPAVPDELWSSIAHLVPVGVDQVYGRPEHQTRVDGYARARQHDLFACARRKGQTVLVVGIEAKACEDFAGVVADRAPSGPPSNNRAWCNLLARALFARNVFDAESGEILDEALAGHGYQLWTAAVGTIIEAQQRGVDQAALVVHQFRPGDLNAVGEAGDLRDWRSALTANGERFDAFARAIEDSGSTSHETEFVKAGTMLHVVKVESTLGRQSSDTIQKR